MRMLRTKRGRCAAAAGGVAAVLVASVATAALGIPAMTAHLDNDGDSRSLLANGDFDDGVKAWWAVGDAPDVVADPGTGGDKALRAKVPAGLAQPWDRMVGQTGFSVKKGTSYVLRFTARADVPTTVRVTVQVEAAPYTPALDTRISLGKEAADVVLPFTPGQDIAEAALTFQLGGGAATTVFLDDVSAETSSASPRAPSPTEAKPGAGTSTPAPKTSTGAPKTGTPQQAAPKGAPSAGAVPAVSVSGDVAANLDSPWGIARLPDGDALVASRNSGKVSRVGPNTPRAVEVGRVPGSAHRGEGGLLGIALSPGFARDGWVYLYTTTADDNRLLRMKYARDTGLTSAQVLLSGIPAGSTHNGGRIAFGPDGMLYIGTGEAGDKPMSQNRDMLGGKILRVTPEGRPAPGNPFPGSPVYSLGHRNVQGIAWDSAGRLWAAEFGQDRYDEINLITPGANYGWPEVEGRAGNPKFTDPLMQWTPDQASPSGIAIVDDVIYVACLRGQRLWQVPIAGNRLGTAKPFLHNTYGRLRTVLPVPGGLWVSTSNTDSPNDRILHVRLK